MKKRLAIIFIVASMISLILISCNKGEAKEKIKTIEIPKNLVVQKKDESINYNTIEEGTLKGVTIDVQGEIMTFNKNAIVSILKGDKLQLIITKENGKESIIDIENTLDNIKLNESGSKVIFRNYLEDQTINYQVVDIETLERNTLKEDVVISGDLVEFLDDENIIFYGVDVNNKKSGLFTLNLTNNEYTLIKETSGVFLEYIDILEDKNIIYLSADINGNKQLKIYNKDTKTEELVSEKVKDIKSLNENGEYIYFTGELTDNGFSLYSLNKNNKNIKRLIFDFPKQFIKNSKIIVEDDKLYIVGYDVSEDQSEIFTYNLNDKSISKIDSIKSLYIILGEI